MSAVYPKWKEALLQGAADSDLLTGDVRIAFVDASGTYSPSDEFISAFSGTILAQSAADLTGKTFTNGLFSADDITIPYGSGGTVVAIVLYIDTGSSATSRLVAYFDSGFAGLPFATDGNPKVLTFPAGILQL